MIVVVPLLKSTFAVVIDDAASNVRVPPLNSIVPAPSYAPPTSVPPPARLSVPLCTLTAPVLLKIVSMYDVAPPDSVHVPSLFTAAFAPELSAPSFGA